MSQPIRGQGGHLVFPIGPKNTKLVEDVEVLLPVKIRWIPISGFRGEVENVSANQRPGRPSCFSDRPEKHKLGRGHWDFASCQVSFNSIQRFQRRSRKCLSQSEARASHLVFPIGPKNTNLVEDVEVLLPVNIGWIWLSGFRGEVEHVSANQRPGRPSCFSYRPEKHKIGRGRWGLASCQVSLNSDLPFQREKSKMSQPIRSQGGHLVFSIGPKNTNLVEDIEILLPVKFHWIPFNGFRGEVENVSANQRPGRPSCFSDRPEKHKIGRGRWGLASCQVSLNSNQRFQRRRSQKCLSQSEARAAILFFALAPEKHKLGRGCWVLASCQVSLNSVQPFQRRSRKCEKLTTDDGRTDDGRRTTRDHNSALEPSAQVQLKNHNQNDKSLTNQSVYWFETVSL